ESPIDSRRFRKGQIRSHRVAFPRSRIEDRAVRREERPGHASLAESEPAELGLEGSAQALEDENAECRTGDCDCNGCRGDLQRTAMGPNASSGGLDRATGF